MPAWSSVTMKLTAVVVALLAALFATATLADTLVTRDGTVITTHGPWRVKGNQIIFTDTTGVLRSIRLTEVDLEASRAATERARQGAAEPPAPRLQPAGGVRPATPERPVALERIPLGGTGERPNLLDPGAPPRSVLRYSWPEGARETARIAIQVKVRVLADGWVMPDLQSAPVRMVVDLGPLRAGPEAGLQIPFLLRGIELGSVTGEGAISMPLKALGMTGWSGSSVMTRDGRELSAEMRVPKQRTEEISSLIEQLRSEGMLSFITVFPEQPIGVGARWSRQRKVSQEGLLVPIEETFTLTYRQGQDAIVSIAYAGRVDSPSVDWGEEWGGAVVESFSTTGSGRARLNLERLVSAWQADTSSVAELRFESADEVAQGKVHVNVKVSVSPARRPRGAG